MRGVIFSVVLFNLAAAPALSCAATPPTGADMTGDQFKSSIVGRTLQVEGTYGGSAYSATSVFDSDGKFVEDWTSGHHSGHYTGNWSIAGNKVCVAASAADGGKTACWSWRKLSDGSFVTINSDGSLHTTAKVSK